MRLNLLVEVISLVKCVVTPAGEETRSHKSPKSSAKTIIQYSVNQNTYLYDGITPVAKPRSDGKLG